MSITKTTTIEYAWHGKRLELLSPTHLLGALAWTCAEIDRLKNPKIPPGCIPHDTVTRGDNQWK